MILLEIIVTSLDPVPFIVIFSFWKRSKTREAESSDYGGSERETCCFQPEIHAQTKLSEQMRFYG
jgi:hypothetical protein